MMTSRLRWPDVSVWTRERFATLLAVLLLACGWMAANGARGHATLRQAHYRNLALWHSKSPVPYLTPLPATVHLPAALGAGGVPLILVRADSVVDTTALCELVDGGEPVAWIALSAAVEPCVGRAGRRLVSLAAASADSLRAVIDDARWLVVDDRARILYSRRTVPTVGELRGVVSFLASARSSSSPTSEPKT